MLITISKFLGLLLGNGIGNLATVFHPPYILGVHWRNSGGKFQSTNFRLSRYPTGVKRIQDKDAISHQSFPGKLLVVVHSKNDPSTNFKEKYHVTEQFTLRGEQEETVIEQGDKDTVKYERDRVTKFNRRS